ncbi:class I SAM-dependent methyltransferase [Cyanobium gracile UHCC 0139]|uniref:Class I SAM-dependent methyltransferase n=1 Tax=Cyanobium gracile UHCC 0139 TaxID=3110308 RepID=A0ABU5RSE1_9CYAN|nr:class I SAM-dependent methyltransferase [Cyanobium gracile]MEA5390691.1 class I SAM-dependent methyltransferase [Cyanobium gracile UHCC 0139]
MERICEPELMDEPLQAQAYAAADFSSSDRAVLERIAALPALLGSGDGTGLSVVDLGCGPGNITFLLARRWPEARVLGIDGSAAMLAIAERRRLADPAAHRQVRFQRLVLPSPELEGPCSAVVSNSLLHHLHDPAVLWGAVKQLSGPDTSLFVRDLRRPANAADLEALVVRHAGAAPEVLRRDYSHSLRAAFTPAEVREQLVVAGLGGLEVREVDDRYLEIQGHGLPGRLAP